SNGQCHITTFASDPDLTHAELTETSCASGPLTPPSPGNSDWPDANPAPISEPKKATTTIRMATPSPRADSWRNRLTDTPSSKPGPAWPERVFPSLSRNCPALLITSQARSWIVRR